MEGLISTLNNGEDQVLGNDKQKKLCVHDQNFAATLSNMCKWKDKNFEMKRIKRIYVFVKVFI